MTKMLMLSAIFLCSTTFAQEIATVVLIKGEAYNGANLLKNGDRVASGSSITTRDKSFVRIKFDDQVAIQAGANTEFKVNRNDKKDNTLLELVRGEVLSRVQPKAVFHERFTVKTQNAVMGVRGTTLFTHTQKDKPTFLCVCGGKVATRFNGKEEVIKTTKHDRPVDIGSDLKDSTAPVAHTEEDIQELGKLLAKSN